MLLKLSVVVLVVVQCGANVLNTVETVTTFGGSSTSSGILDVMLCPFNGQPWQCARQTASRVLNDWDRALAQKLIEFKVEADAEVERNAIARGLTDTVDVEELRKRKPSLLMQTIEKGAETIGDFVSHGVDALLSQTKKGDDETMSLDANAPQDTIESIVNQMPSDLIDDSEHEDNDQGRSIGEKRGKAGSKKKKRKALMKVLLIAGLIKGKIELLLKLLSTHLQLKFFAIALLGLIINLARFWVELKRGHQPQKVIYYEHAQHQHHYEDHGDDWGGNGGGSYWRRSIDDDGTPVESITQRSPNPHYYDGLIAYDNNNNNQYYDAHSLAYNNPLKSHILKF